ncbi:MAG: response regulator [Desulfovibrio sp.]|jgi:two-component system chemotaxis response regulator CheY|nr:response regulator [Desulfovibrio sp.]MBI4961183.1 response regulator [Desulfovibrio sp.]
MDQRSIQRLRRLLGETALLVVDDTPIIRDALSGILEPLGLHMILQAGDGEEAWRMLESGKVDMVVADWLMPGINGLDLLRKMRRDERFENIPFIMITGVPDKQMVMEALRFKATDYMAKPIDGSVLKQKIIKALSRKSD